MDYKIAISPDLDVEIVEFVSIWNQSPECNKFADAQLIQLSSESYLPIDPDTVREGLIFLGGVASTIAIDVMKDIIKDQLTKLINKKLPKEPDIEVNSIEQPDGSFLIVVTEKE